MPLGRHKKDEEDRFRRERSDSKAKNLAADYPEFAKLPPETTFGQLEKKYGVQSLDAVRREIKKRAKKRQAIPVQLEPMAPRRSLAIDGTFW